LDFLTALGWTSERAAQLAALDRPELTGARVAAAHRGRLDLLGHDGLVTARVAGRLHHAGDVPTVGDWVAVDRTRAVVHAMLPRHGCIERAAPSGRSESQVLAANVDVALVVGSLNRDLNIPRLVRLLTVVADAGAQAVVVLSKADLVSDPWERVTDVRRALGAAVPALALSAEAGTGLDALDAWLRPGATAVVLGSSGVGKTTLLNVLSDGPPRRTAQVRASDDRGRHATTVRELVLLPSGAIVIDTPGLRKIEPFRGETRTERRRRRTAAG
jgi:ribosome biogenesis GTPase / thiamine phosphate phosphatase